MTVGRPAHRQSLLAAKAEARVRTRLAEERVRAARAAEGSADRLRELDLAADDTEELDALRRHTVDDVKRRLRENPDLPQEEREPLEEELAELQRRAREEEEAGTDLGAQQQVAVERVRAEAAEAALWAEWVRLATTEESDRRRPPPHTHTLSRPAARAGAGLPRKLRCASIPAAIRGDPGDSIGDAPPPNTRTPVGPSASAPLRLPPAHPPVGGGGEGFRPNQPPGSSIPAAAARFADANKKLVGVLRDVAKQVGGRTRGRTRGRFSRLSQNVFIGP